MFLQPSFPFRLVLVLATLSLLLVSSFCQNLQNQQNARLQLTKQLNQKISAAVEPTDQQQAIDPRILLPSLYKLESNGQPQQRRNRFVTPSELYDPQKLVQAHRVYPRMRVVPPSFNPQQNGFDSATAAAHSRAAQIETSYNYLNTLDFSAYGTNGITAEQRAMAGQWLEIVDQQLLEVSDLAKQEHDYYQNKYQIDSYPELPFCIVVPTHNNLPSNRYLRNIRSIVMQNYANFHIVIIDDGSTDGTGEYISEFLREQKVIGADRYRVVRNEQSMKAMFNLRRAANQFCKGEQIFLVVDGDDELLGRQVLKLFNSQFQSNGAWFIYSNFIMDRFGKLGYSRPFTQRAIERNNYRNYPFVTSHLRAFYTQLFRNIKESDLKDQNGEYFKAANDVAICIPILEQSHRRVQYLPELTYYYNSNTGQNNHLIRSMEQRANDKKVRRKQAYSSLPDLLFDSS